MVKITALEATVAGLVIVIDAVPAAARSDAGMATLRCVVSMRVVVRGDPFQFTFAPGTRFQAVTTRLKLPPPCVALVTFKDENVGVGFCCRSCGTMKGPRAR